MARDKSSLELGFKLCTVDTSSKHENKGSNLLCPSNQDVFGISCRYQSLGAAFSIIFTIVSLRIVVGIMVFDS